VSILAWEGQLYPTPVVLEILTIGTGIARNLEKANGSIVIAHSGTSLTKIDSTTSTAVVTPMTITSITGDPTEILSFSMTGDRIYFLNTLGPAMDLIYSQNVDGTSKSQLTFPIGAYTIDAVVSVAFDDNDTGAVIFRDRTIPADSLMVVTLFKVNIGPGTVDPILIETSRKINYTTETLKMSVHQYFSASGDYELLNPGDLMTISTSSDFYEINVDLNYASAVTFCPDFFYIHRKNHNLSYLQFFNGYCIHDGNPNRFQYCTSYSSNIEFDSPSTLDIHHNHKVYQFLNTHEQISSYDLSN